MHRKAKLIYIIDYTVGCHNYSSLLKIPIQIVLNQEFSFGHNFASTPPIYTIQKGADR